MPLAAVAAAAVTAGGAYLSSKANSKAIKKSSKAQQAATDSNIALQRDIYGQNKSALSPFMERGNAAGSAINALLGLGAPASPQPSALSGFGGGDPSIGPYASGGGFGGVRTYGYEGMDGAQGQPYGALSGFNPGWMQQQGPEVAQPTTAQIGPQQAATDAYNIFKQSTGYVDRLNEGYRATNAGYAGRGLVQSGAAQKALLKYGQQQASNEFGNYLGYLGNQQGVGLSGASALAGVGQSFANNVGNINQNQAQFTGQAAVARANNSNSLITGISGAIGGALGGFGGGSSYGSAASSIPYGDGSNMTGGIFRRGF